MGPTNLCIVNLRINRADRLEVFLTYIPYRKASRKPTMHFLYDLRLKTDGAHRIAAIDSNGQVITVFTNLGVCRRNGKRKADNEQRYLMAELDHLYNVPLNKKWTQFSAPECNVST